MTLIEHHSGSQESLEASVADGLSRGVVPSHAHYRTAQQSAAWHAVATSFFDRAPGRSAFDEVYAGIAQRCAGARVHVVALGCGDGVKDEGLARALRRAGSQVDVTLADISPPLLRLASARLADVDGVSVRAAIVCDVTTIGVELGEVIEDLPGIRVVTLFGVLPGLTSLSAFDAARGVLRPGDLFAFSGNMLPPGDGQIERLCEFYASAPSHDWMALVFSDGGVAGPDLSWTVEPAYESEVRAVATVSVKAEVRRDCDIRFGNEVIALPQGRVIDVFRSHRHSVDSIGDIVGGLGLSVLDLRLSDSAEEGVVLAAIGP